MSFLAALSPGSLTHPPGHCPTLVNGLDGRKDYRFVLVSLLARQRRSIRFLQSIIVDAHMAASRQNLRTGVQIVLGIAIIVLSYFLYRAITEPYERIERQQELTEQTRERMSNIRTALVDYERDSASFPDSLDTLRVHIERDSLLRTAQDSIFGGPLNLDSLFFSPRTGSRFLYTVSDTGKVETYLLEDPDTDDKIGTLTGDPTQTNVASWE